MSSGSTKKDMGEIDMATVQPISRRAHEARAEAEEAALRKVDGRSLRRRGRTETFSTKTTRDVIETIQRIASVEGISMVEVVERAVDAYDKRLRGQK